MSRRREIKVEELLDLLLEVRNRGEKILPQLEGQPREVVEELVVTTGVVLADESKVQDIRNLSETDLDTGLKHGRTYLMAISNAEEICEGTMPQPFSHSHLH